MKTPIRLAIIALLLLLCTTPASAAPVTLHRCTVFIEHATPDELILELWSTSQSTRYSVNINYSWDHRIPCSPWDGHEENWVAYEYLLPGLYTLSWIDFYDRNPEPGTEACINWACQPEVVVIYWSQDYQMILDYLFLPVVRR